MALMLLPRLSAFLLITAEQIGSDHGERGTAASGWIAPQKSPNPRHEEPKRRGGGARGFRIQGFYDLREERNRRSS
uniref:Secreted protein n=1 Tax=Arundo donax TaxID=35708 RepID=A0A0A9F029_ARUDO